MATNLAEGEDWFIHIPTPGLSHNFGSPWLPNLFWNLTGCYWVMVLGFSRILGFTGTLLGSH